MVVGRPERATQNCITALAAKLAKAHQVEQGMMSELLTGSVRLV